MSDDNDVSPREPYSSIRKFLETANNFSSVAVYRLTLEEAVGFLYTTNKHAEKEIVDTLLFTLVSKYVGVNPDKEVKDLCNENITSLKKEKDTRR